MTYLVMGVILIVCTVLQIQMPGYAVLGGAKIPFLLSVCLYYSLTRETGVMLAAAFCAGFLQDSLSEIPLGYSAFLFCLLGWAVSRFRNFVVSESFVTPTFFGGVASLIFTISIYMWLAADGLVSFGAGRLFMRFVGAGFLGMICAPVVFFLTRKLDQLVGNVEFNEEIDVFE